MKKILAILVSTMLFIIPTFSVYAETNIPNNFENDSITDLSSETNRNYYCNIKEFTPNQINEYTDIHANQKFDILNSIASGKTICSMVNYEYFISETYDENGNIVDSHIMTTDEINENRLKTGYAVQSGWIGSDFGEKGKLSIGIVLIKNTDNTYTVLGNAKWDTTSIVGGSNYPDAAGDDFFAITWGGNGELQCTKYTVSGYYQNGNKISISKSKSDAYKGYCWQFLEKSSGTGSCMKDLSADVTLKKTYSANRNKTTNVKCTYIHTYSKVNGTVSLTAGKEGLAGGITLSSTDKQWTVECDVKGINY